MVTDLAQRQSVPPSANAEIATSARIPWHPPLIAVAFVLQNYIESGVHVAAIGRALIVAVLLAVALQALGWLVSRSRHFGSMAASSILVLGIAWVPLVVMGQAIVGLPAWQAAILIAPLMLLVLAVARLAFVHRGRIWRLTRVMNILSAALLAVVMVQLATSPTAGQGLRELVGPSTVSAMSAVPAGTDRRPPDIYVLLLDGHPRADSLLEQLGTDVQPFLDQLAARRFTISDRGVTNYGWTSASLSSMLHMQYLHELPDVVLDPDDPVQMRRSMAESPGPAHLRSAGYEITAVGPPYEHVALRSADRFVDAGYLNSFECHLIRRTMIGSIAWHVSPGFLGDTRREAITRSMSTLEDIAREPSSRPRFVLVHLPTPHLPLLWDAEGNPVDDPAGSDCAPQFATGLSADEVQPAYLAQLQHVQGLVLESIDAVLAASDDPPVLLVLSDHGGKLGAAAIDPASPEGWRDRFGILFAAHTPGTSTMFPDEVSLVNVLPSILNEYLEADLPIRPSRTFGTTDGDLGEVPMLGH
ncbi:MAG: hypothetical protein ACRDGV_06270 [Candidatus Limnocylindria bacterium]